MGRPGGRQGAAGLPVPSAGLGDSWERRTAALAGTATWAQSPHATHGIGCVRQITPVGQHWGWGGPPALRPWLHGAPVPTAAVPGSSPQAHASTCIVPPGSAARPLASGDMETARGHGSYREKLRCDQGWREPGGHGGRQDGGWQSQPCLPCVAPQHPHLCLQLGQLLRVPLGGQRAWGVWEGITTGFSPLPPSSPFPWDPTGLVGRDTVGPHSCCCPSLLLPNV